MPILRLTWRRAAVSDPPQTAAIQLLERQKLLAASAPPACAAALASPTEPPGLSDAYSTNEQNIRICQTFVTGIPEVWRYDR